MPLLRLGLPGLTLCVLALSCPANLIGQNASSSTAAQPGSPDRAIAPATAGELPDSPSVIWAKSQNPPQQNQPTQATGSQSDSQKTDKHDRQNEQPQRPIGTAAAEAPRVSGVTAAQPAGAAIAPAKQKRVRTLVLKVGAILGAGAAIGTVVALSAATPSKPPGAH